MEGVSDCSALSPRAARTLDDLRDAARTLACTQPLDQISVDDIARQARVSRRTFFNHFQTKNEAFLPNIDNPPEVLARVAAGEPPQLADALGEVVGARAAQIIELRERYPGYFEAMVSNSDMLPLLREERMDRDADVRRAFARRLGADEDDALIHLIATLSFAVERVAFLEWKKDPEGDDLGTITARITRELAHALGCPRD